MVKDVCEEGGDEDSCEDGDDEGGLRIQIIVHGKNQLDLFSNISQSVRSQEPLNYSTNTIYNFLHSSISKDVSVTFDS